jgi:hypothetical protein
LAFAADEQAAVGDPDGGADNFAQLAASQEAHRGSGGGVAKVRGGKTDQTTTSRLSILLVRENDRWLIAVLRDWPDEGITLHDLDWLIGTWDVKTDSVEVRTSYAWDEGKTTLNVTVCGFSSSARVSPALPIISVSEAKSPPTRLCWH